MNGEDLPVRVLHLEHSVSSIREQMAQLATEQKHVTRTLDRVDQRTEAMCRSIEEIPRISSLIRDPRTVLLLVALFGGAVGVDTVAASLVSSVAEASP
jgi:hypothetical protein|tara:strand:+ start:10169 stop:10462 length:294 start_codon:yes stop_codon:yes gene_type:complete